MLEPPQQGDSDTDTGLDTSKKTRPVSIPTLTMTGCGTSVNWS